jgi:hypothetical protein
MGMFSWECKGCGDELCDPEIGLAKSDEFNIVSGSYDGYGRLGDSEIDPFESAVWHLKCYQEATPEQQADLTPSASAENQGFGRGNPKFCTPKDAECIIRGIALEKKKEQQHAEGKIFPCHQCHENMVSESELTCGCFADSTDEESMGYFQEERDRFNKSVENIRSNDWGEEFLKDHALAF